MKKTRLSDAKSHKNWAEKCLILTAKQYSFYVTESLTSIKYEGNSISKLQIQVATYVFELSAGNCHR